MERERSELGPRKGAVLCAVVEQYVRERASRSAASRSPSTPASACRAPRSATRWPRSRSSATCPHPHTSAGRIPTDTGYRHYVDSLPAGGRLRDAQRRLIAGYFAEAIVDLEEVLKGSVQLLSRLTQYAGLAVPPSATRGAHRSRRADRHGADPDDPGGRPARPGRQAGDRQARRGRRRRPCATPIGACRSFGAELPRCAGAVCCKLAAESTPRRSAICCCRSRDAAGGPGGACRAHGRRRCVEPGRRGAADAPRDPAPAVRDARA